MYQTAQLANFLRLKVEKWSVCFAICFSTIPYALTLPLVEVVDITTCPNRR
jgi:hypothetical protein